MTPLTIKIIGAVVAALGCCTRQRTRSVQQELVCIQQTLAAAERALLSHSERVRCGSPEPDHEPLPARPRPASALFRQASRSTRAAARSACRTSGAARRTPLPMSANAPSCTDRADAIECARSRLSARTLSCRTSAESPIRTSRKLPKDCRIVARWASLLVLMAGPRLRSNPAIRVSPACAPTDPPPPESLLLSVLASTGMEHGWHGPSSRAR